MLRTAYLLGCLMTICSIGALCSGKAHVRPRPEVSTLIVTGVAAAPVSLSAADLGKLSHRGIKAKDPGGEEIEFEVVSLGDVLKRAGMDFESDKHGRGLTRYLLVEAADKYRVVFSLPEIDPDYTDRTVCLAIKREGKPIPADEGPFRLIVPADKRHARWVRQVRTLSIIDSVPADQRNKKP